MKHFKRNTYEVFNSCAEALQDKVHSHIICMFPMLFFLSMHSLMCALMDTLM